MFTGKISVDLRTGLVMASSLFFHSTFNSLFQKNPESGVRVLAYVFCFFLAAAGVLKTYTQKDFEMKD
jgi:uncharacterized integral membrane protein